MEWMQILALVAGGMMLFAIWPMYKNWRANPTEAQPGDWSTAVFILGLVMLFVLMLIWSVQSLLASNNTQGGQPTIIYR